MKNKSINRIHCNIAVLTNLGAMNLEKRIPESIRIPFYNFVFDILESESIGWHNRTIQQALTYVQFHRVNGVSGLLLEFICSNDYADSMESRKVELQNIVNGIQG